jgi:cell division protein FtsB
MGLNTRWWNIGIFVISAVLLALWTHRLVGDVRAYSEARAIKRARLEELERLRTQRDQALEYVYKLRSDRETLERLVRSMGYVRPNEEVYIIPQLKSASETSENAPENPTQSGPFKTP